MPASNTSHNREIVKDTILELFHAGLPHHQIAAQLNEKGYRTTHGTPFSEGSIKSYCKYNRLTRYNKPIPKPAVTEQKTFAEIRAEAEARAKLAPSPIELRSPQPQLTTVTKPTPVVDIDQQKRQDATMTVELMRTILNANITDVQKIYSIIPLLSRFKTQPGEKLVQPHNFKVGDQVFDKGDKRLCVIRDLKDRVAQVSPVGMDTFTYFVNFDRLQAQP